MTMCRLFLVVWAETSAYVNDFSAMATMYEMKKWNGILDEKAEMLVMLNTAIVMTQIECS